MRSLCYILSIIIIPEHPVPIPVPLNLPVPLSPFIMPVRVFPPIFPLWTKVCLILTAPLLEILPTNPVSDDTMPSLMETYVESSRQSPQSVVARLTSLHLPSKALSLFG